MGKLYGHKFKVGDKVEVIKDNYEHVKGQIRTISALHTEVHSSFDYRLAEGGLIAEHNIKLVEEPAFKKGDNVFYIARDTGKKVNREVDRVEGDVVWFTNGMRMPAERLFLLPQAPPFKKGDFVYYNDWDGKKVERVVAGLEDGNTTVRFTNGNYMPTKSVFLDHAIRGTGIGTIAPKGTPKGDNVNQPAHYTAGGIETLDYIKAKLSKEEIAGYYAGNILKYVSRYKQKNGVEDLKKAEFYLRELIALQAVEHEDGFMGE